MKVVQVMRKPNDIVFSIEQLFEGLRRELTVEIDVETYVNPYSSRGVWRRLAGMLRVVRHQGDVNHVTGDVHYLSILLHRNKTILTIHDCVTLERLGGLKYKFFWFFWYWLPIKRSRIVTVISESTKHELLRHLGSGDWDIKVIPNFVSPDFQYSKKRFNSVRPVILQVGTKRNKNIERVAKALNGIECKMVIIGRLLPEQKAVLRENKIDYECSYGVTHDVIVECYRFCDIVMFASLYEGFGLPILEAQAVGRPVITSDLFSMPEVGGEGACYVDPYSVEDIRAAVVRIVADVTYRKGLVMTGFSNVEKYQLSNIAGQYAELYRQVYAEANT
jgi:glycosyltransferase involved in cell wall biosynthesis